MSEKFQANTWRTEADMKKDLRRRKIEDMKSSLYLKISGIFWRTLWLMRLGKPYSKFMCQMGWYRKFSNGRCMYCGVLK